MTASLARAIAASVLATTASVALAADDAAQTNRRLARGMNLGNMLEAPSEGEWGLRVKDQWLPKIRAAGFNSVRIPVRWSAHAAAEKPYAIDPEFFQRVEHIVRQALAARLHVVLNVHHYDEIFNDPEKHRARLVALWSQIADRFRDLPPSVCFEILNEPHGKLTPELWNQVYPQALAAIRKSNPNRVVIVGPGEWNAWNQLEKLALPEDDRQIIATFHYYLPFAFTHQGASWAGPSAPPLGRKWTATASERQEIQQHFDAVAAWAKKHRRPVLLGEFGAYEKGDMESRARWTRFVRTEAESRGFSWAYWELASGFGAMDPETDAWRAPLRDALLAPGK